MKSASKDLTFMPDTSKSKSRSRKVSPSPSKAMITGKALKKNIVTEMKAVDKFLNRMKLAQDKKKEVIKGT